MKKNRKNLRILAVLFVVFSLLLVGNTAVFAAYENPTLTLTDFQAMPGDTFTTTLSIDEDAGIIDFQIQLQYDTDLLTLVSAAENEDCGGTVIFNDSKDGVISVTYSRTKNNSKEIPVLDLTFKADDNIGVGLYDSITVDTSSESKADSLVSGVLVEVPLETDFRKLSIYQTGDVDLNNKLQITDATTIRLHLAYTEDNPTLAKPLTDFQLKLADTRVDGNVTITDASYIQMKLVDLNVNYGNRRNITFYDADGNQCAVKSVAYGGELNRLPAVPAKTGYSGGSWSAQKGEYEKPVLTNIENDLELYAYYDGEFESEAIAYYKELLTSKYYSGDIATGLSGNLNLDAVLKWQKGYTADVTWASSNSYILNSTTGVFNQPTYPSELTLVAKIVSRDADDTIEGRSSIAFTYQVPGKFNTPDKATIAKCLKTFFTYDPDEKVEGDEYYQVNYDMKLPQRLANNQMYNAEKDKEYEVRISWSSIEGGKEVPLSEIKRSTTSKTMDLVATITFNGEPLEDDGKVYLDEVHVSAITEYEIKNYIIGQVAANMGSTLSTGVALWDYDTVYGTKLNWQSNNVEMADISNNTLTVSTATLNGALLPITAEVSYTADEKVKTFNLEYTVAVTTDNTLLEPGTNITAELYNAIKNELADELDFHGNITTGVLRDYRFVNLDLTGYPEVTSLKGLSYCKNLRTLNISGLHITEGMNEICTLSKLEAFVAKGCGLDNLTDGGKAVLQNSINLRMLDLSDNHFTNLDSVFGAGVRYSGLREVYINDNQLTDISALSSAPAITYLSLANNGLDSSDLDKITSFTTLRYLSLAYNKIDNVSSLENLKYLTELRLHNNQISDVRPLKKMIYMEALYLGHNQIRSGIDFLDNMTQLKVLYLNDNNIDDINNLVSLENLQAINVSNNPDLNNLSVLSRYTGTLEEIYAENDALTSFSFIDGMTKLRILMLANNAPGETDYSDLLTSQLSELKEMQILTLSGKPLYDLNFLANMPNLVRLDVANCRLGAFSGENSNIEAIANHYKTITILDISHNDMSGSESEINKLKNMSNLTILYADDICDGFDADTITKEMVNLKLISLENNGITTLNWLTRFRGLVYVDLAGNGFTSVDLGTQIGSRNRETLKYLYLETDQPCTFANVYMKLDENVLKELSLSGVNIPSLSYLPYMDDLEYLNLSNTGLTSLYGHDDPDLYDVYSIERFKNLKTLDVSGVQADITPLQNLPNLGTLFGISVPEDTIFHQTDLHVMQKLYNKGVNEYLYAYNDPYLPSAQREGAEILNLLDDFSCNLMIAADGAISDNNPILPAQINDFDISWFVSNDVNYEIKDGKIGVKDYTNIDDETMTLTAQIKVYPDQEPAERKFTINTKILRATDSTRNLYYNASSDGYGEVLQRNAVFSYDVTLQNGTTEGFADPVKPVESEIRYSYSSTLEDGTVTPYGIVLTESENHRYTINSDAPLKSNTMIRIEIGHYIDESFIVDDYLELPFKVVERTYSVTYVANGGSIVDSKNIPVTQNQTKAEEDLLLSDISVSRSGYLFDGWYTNESCTELFWQEGDEYPLMPSNDLTLYAKWRPNSYTITFDANEGSVETRTATVLCNEPIGEMPEASRDYYSFAGWFTEKEGGKEITSETVITAADDFTVYAHWTHNPVSEWVLESSVPESAEVVSEKWTYDEKSYTDSQDDSIEGWTQYDNYWQQSGSGSFNYGNFSNSSNPYNSIFKKGDGLYTKYNKSPYTSYKKATTKRVASTKALSKYIYWHWTFWHSGKEGNYLIATSANDINNGYNQWYAFESSTNAATSNSVYGTNKYPYVYYYTGIGHLSWHWFRIPLYQCTYTDYVKMFKFYKIDSKESASEVTVTDNISNVEHWVQYRAK